MLKQIRKTTVVMLIAMATIILSQSVILADSADTGNEVVVERTVTGPYGSVTDEEHEFRTTGFGDDPVTIAASVFLAGVGLLFARQYAQEKLVS